MANRILAITINMIDGRFHGEGDWPPSPFRVFQALVAATYLGRRPSKQEISALHVLQEMSPPVVCCPVSIRSKRFTHYLPNNSLDKYGGDLLSLPKIRSATKNIQPYIFDNNETGFIYLWKCEEVDESEVQPIVSLANRLYQFGRGVDVAYSYAELLDKKDFDELINNYNGTLYYPSDEENENGLRCPKSSSLDSLFKRHEAQLHRFDIEGTLQKVPEPDFSKIVYENPPARFLFNLEHRDNPDHFRVYPTENIIGLTTRIRDNAAERLKQHFTENDIERFIIGRGANESDKNKRIRIISIPSIGDDHADCQIRRILLEIPGQCPLDAEDVAWAFSGLDLGVDLETGELLNFAEPVLVPTEDTKMLQHYGVCSNNKEGFRIWRSVTPVALTIIHNSPTQTGISRVISNAKIVHATKQAVRHSGIPYGAEILRIQHEPFSGRGIKSDNFINGSRFTQRNLYHVEIEFDRPVRGPVIIGNGRYVGLGLMQPIESTTSDFTLVRFELHGNNLPSTEDTVRVAECLRLGLMGKAKRILGENNIPRILSGHDMPENNKHDHAFYLPEDADGDGHIDHVVIYAKSGFSRDTLRVLKDTTRLWNRKGQEWQMILEDYGPYERMRAYTPLLGEAACWISATPYLHPWFQKKNFTVEDQIKKECRIRGLPEPVEFERLESITIKGRERKPIHFHRFRNKRGLTQPDTQGSFWKLTFPKPVSGPLALGFGCHYGLGMFRSK